MRTRSTLPPPNDKAAMHGCVTHIYIYYNVAMIKKLSHRENLLFRTGAILLVAGLLVRMPLPLPGFALMAVGAVLYTTMQWRAEYQGSDITLGRLRKQQLLSCALLLIAVVLLGMQTFRVGGRFQRGEWVLCLAIAAFIQLYTAWRIPSELEKRQAK